MRPNTREILAVGTVALLILAMIAFFAWIGYNKPYWARGWGYNVPQPTPTPLPPNVHWRIWQSPITGKCYEVARFYNGSSSLGDEVDCNFILSPLYFEETHER